MSFSAKTLSIFSETLREKDAEKINYRRDRQTGLLTAIRRFPRVERLLQLQAIDFLDLYGSYDNYVSNPVPPVTVPTIVGPYMDNERLDGTWTHMECYIGKEDSGKQSQGVHQKLVNSSSLDAMAMVYYHYSQPSPMQITYVDPASGNSNWRIMYVQTETKTIIKWFLTKAQALAECDGGAVTKFPKTSVGGGGMGRASSPEYVGGLWRVSKSYSAEIVNGQQEYQQVGQLVAPFNGPEYDQVYWLRPFLTPPYPE